MGSIRTKVLTLFIITQLILTGTFLVMEIYKEHEKIEIIGNEHLGDSQKVFDSLVENDIDKLSIALDIFMEDQEYKDIFLSGDRDALYQYGQPLFTNLKEDYGVTHFYFHNLNGTCFVRLHNYDTYGDVITRYTFYQARDSGVIGAGLELGKTAFALRVVKPYYNGDQLIGYVEFGEEIDHFLESMNEQFGDDMTLVIDKQYLDEDKWNSVIDVSGTVNNWDDMEDHVIVGSSMDDPEEMIGLACDDGDLADAIEEKELFKVHESSGIVFQSGGYPLIDVEGNHVGAVVLCHDITDYEEAKDKATAQWVIVSGIIMISSILITALFAKRFVIRPLNELITAARKVVYDNEMDTPIDIQSNDEIGELAEMYRRLINTTKNAIMILKQQEKGD